MPMLCTRLVALGCGLLGGIAHAATFSVPLHFEPVTLGADQWLAASFDLGLQFERIESATVSVVLEEEFTPFLACTGHSCSGSQLLLDVVSLGESGDPFVPDIAGLYASPFGQLTGDNIWERNLGLYVFNGPLINEEGELNANLTGSYVWPEGLLQGRGMAVLAVVRTSSGTSLNPGARYFRRLSLPVGTTPSVTLTVTGTLVPEPSSFAMALALVSLAGFKRASRLGAKAQEP